MLHCPFCDTKSQVKEFSIFKLLYVHCRTKHCLQFVSLEKRLKNGTISTGSLTEIQARLCAVASSVLPNPTSINLISSDVSQRDQPEPSTSTSIEHQNNIITNYDLNEPSSSVTQVSEEDWDSSIPVFSVSSPDVGQCGSGNKNRILRPFFTEKPINGRVSKKPYLNDAITSSEHLLVPAAQNEINELWKSKKNEMESRKGLLIQNSITRVKKSNSRSVDLPVEIPIPNKQLKDIMVVDLADSSSDEDIGNTVVEVDQFDDDKKQVNAYDKVQFAWNKAVVNGGRGRRRKLDHWSSTDEDDRSISPSPSATLSTNPDVNPLLFQYESPSLPMHSPGVSSHSKRKESKKEKKKSSKRKSSPPAAYKLPSDPVDESIIRVNKSKKDKRDKLVAVKPVKTVDVEKPITRTVKVTSGAASPVRISTKKCNSKDARRYRVQQRVNRVTRSRSRSPAWRRSRSVSRRRSRSHSSRSFRRRSTRSRSRSISVSRSVFRSKSRRRNRSRSVARRRRRRSSTPPRQRYRSGSHRRGSWSSSSGSPVSRRRSPAAKASKSKSNGEAKRMEPVNMIALPPGIPVVKKTPAYCEQRNTGYGSNNPKSMHKLDLLLSISGTNNSIVDMDIDPKSVQSEPGTEYEKVSVRNAECIKSVLSYIRSNNKVSVVQQHFGIYSKSTSL